MNDETFEFIEPYMNFETSVGDRLFSIEASYGGGRYAQFLTQICLAAYDWKRMQLGQTKVDIQQRRAEVEKKKQQIQ